MRQTLWIAAALVAATTVVTATQRNDPRPVPPADVVLKTAMNQELVDGDPAAAARRYRDIATRYRTTAPAVAAKALVLLAESFEKSGNAAARTTYEELLRDFPNERDAAARARARLGATALNGAGGVKSARQVWAGPDVTVPGSPSPDGRYLGYEDMETGDLALRDLVAGTTRRLTNTGGWKASGDYAEWSVISPDGRQAAYLWFVAKASRYELRIVAVTGSVPAPARTLLPAEAAGDYAKPVAWTPDGRSLIVLRSRADRTHQIGIVSIQDGAYRNIKSLDWRYPDKVSLSPDGHNLAYDVPAGDNGSPRDIFLLATDGSRETTLVRGSKNDTSPVWSPDGAHVLFVSDRTGSTSLWSIRVAPGTPQAAVLVKSDIGAAVLLGTASNGSLYYHLPEKARQNVYVADLEPAAARRQPALATENYIDANAGPAWSRDGQSLAYYSFRNPTVLVVRTVVSGVERSVPLPAGVLGGVKWFSDGRAVLVRSQPPQGSGVQFSRLTLDTGRLDPLWRLKEGAGAFDLSPDDGTIICAVESDNGRISRVLRFDIGAQRETELTTDDRITALAISPDGAELAYVKTIRGGFNAIEMMPIAGGPSREVYSNTDWPGNSRFNLAWTPDRRALLFVKPVEKEEVLWRIAVSEGQPERIGISLAALERPGSFTMHPDGKQIAFSARQPGGSEVWVLDNFLAKLDSSK